MAAFQQAAAELEGEEIALIAASTDVLDDARGTVDELGLTFPVGCALPLEQTANALGAYYEERRGILHATGFLVRPDGTIGVALYSSGAIGRLLPDEILRLVRFWKQRDGR